MTLLLLSWTCTIAYSPLSVMYSMVRTGDGGGRSCPLGRVCRRRSWLRQLSVCEQTFITIAMVQYYTQLIMLTVK